MISKILAKSDQLMDPLFHEFFLAKQSMAPTSFKSYFHLLNKFDDFLTDIQLPVVEVETKHCSEFINLYSKLAMKSRKTYKIYLQSFFAWVQRRGDIKLNPVEEVVLQGDSRKKEKPLMTEEDFKKVSSRCEGLRESTIVHFLWYTGVRAKEICSIKVNDINLADKSLFVSVSKSSKGNRPIPIHRSLFLLLLEYMKKRNSFALDHDFLFINKQGNPLEYRTLLRLLHRISKKKFATHAYRRGLITQVYDKTQDIMLARQIAGHSSVETTQGYILGDIKRLKKFRELDL